MIQEKYIWEEWERITKKAEKKLTSDCPLLEDEVIVQMNNLIANLLCAIVACKSYSKYNIGSKKFLTNQLDEIKKICDKALK